MNPITRKSMSKLVTARFQSCMPNTRNGRHLKNPKIRDMYGSQAWLFAKGLYRQQCFAKIEEIKAGHAKVRNINKKSNRICNHSHKVQRAKDMVAAESGIIRGHSDAPATCPRPPRAIPPGQGGADNVELPRYSLPSEGLPLNAKAKIQAKINQFGIFKPSREDTKRFLPRNVPEV